MVVKCALFSQSMATKHNSAIAETKRLMIKVEFSNQKKTVAQIKINDSMPLRQLALLTINIIINHSEKISFAQDKF